MGFLTSGLLVPDIHFYDQISVEFSGLSFHEFCVSVKLVVKAFVVFLVIFVD